MSEEKLFVKKCKVCGTEYPYDDIDELHPYFYKKSGYYINTCIKCELEKHAKKYQEGIYAHKKRNLNRYIDNNWYKGGDFGNNNGF